MPSVQFILGKMLQTRFILLFISVISNIYCQFPFPIDDSSPLPALDTTPVTIEASAGETVLLPCSVTNLGSHTITWLTSRYEPLTDNEQVVIDDDTRLSVIVIGIEEQVSEWNLKIENVEGADSGKYMCLVQAIPPQTKPVELTVREVPSIMENSFQPIIELAEGKPLAVSCITKGMPKPKVNWYIQRPLPNGTTRELYQGGPLLTINAVRRTDSGTYICEATNQMGKMEKQTILEINYKPTVSMAATRIHVKEGADGIMECSAEGNPAPQIMWLRFNYRLTTSIKHEVQTYADSQRARTAVLVVKNMEREDAGRYRCMARNKVGQEDEYVKAYVIPSTTTSTTTTTTTATTTIRAPTPMKIITTSEPRIKPPIKPDELTKTTLWSTTKSKENEIYYTNNPRTGEAKDSAASKTHTNFVALLLLLTVPFLQKLS